MAAFNHIKESDLTDAFDAAKKFMSPLHSPLDEYERIASNKPHSSIAKNLPKVTDGTLAALVQDQPKRVIQQIPTGLIKADDEWLELVGGYILSKEILPNNNQVAALLQKCWALVSKSLTYGSQPAYVQFINRGEYFGTDFTLPYIKDVLLEPGKLSDRDSNVIFMRTWWSASQIDQIIEKEKALKGRAKDRGEDYESGWNLGELAKLKDEKTQKPEESKTPQERKDNQDTHGFIEIVHAFQRGVGACFYSFSPQTKGVVRKKINKDPRGLIPIHFMYNNLDFSNPLGKGIIEMSGGIQNLLDSEMQMYQWNRALMLNPPLKKWGTISSGSLKMIPNAVWSMGANKDVGDVEPVAIDSNALANFPQNHGLLRSQILNLNSGGGDSSTSAEVGNPGFSKTDAGVNALQERLGASDNYIRKQFESTWEEITETEINLYFAERSGVQELSLDDETAMKLRKIAQDAISEDNKIEIDYDTETPKLKFEVDASSSNMKDSMDQVEKAKSLLEIAGPLGLLARDGGPINEIELTDRIVTGLGLEDSEKIVKKPEIDPQTGEAMEQEQEQPPMTPEMVQQMVQEMMDAKEAEKPQVDPLNEFVKAWGIKFTDLPEDAQHELLNRAGVESSGETAQAHQRYLDEARLELDVEQASHQMEQDEATQELNATDRALSIAQAESSERNSDREYSFKEKEAAKPKEKAETKN